MANNYSSEIIRPDNVDQVQELVKCANAEKRTLVPLSSQGKHRNGGTEPEVENAQIVDLSGWKKIISINRTHRMTVVEPGVTYGELQAALKKEGMMLSMPLAPRRDKSVVASVLEVEPRLNANHQWNYFDPLRCTEVTWGDGNNMFTGEAGGSVKNLEEQWKSERWQINGYGPNAFDFVRMLTAAQGTMGIVTWASLKCEVLPTVHKMYSVSTDDMKDAVHFMNEVIRKRFSDELFLVNKASLSALLVDDLGVISSALDKEKEWFVIIGIAGRELLAEMRVEAQKQSIEEIAGCCGLEMKEGAGDFSSDYVLDRIYRTDREKCWKDNLKGAAREIFFITTFGKADEFVLKIRELAEAKNYDVSQMGVYMQPQHCGTSVHLEFIFPYDENDKQETDIVTEIYRDGSFAAAEMDAYFARPYGLWRDIQFEKDKQAKEILKKLKGIFDPNNVMNTGKLI
ncbi:MAG: FAD-binding oxidoreductase [Lentihominibacter sp.]